MTTIQALARQISRQHWLPCEPTVCAAAAFDERDLLPVPLERGQSPHGSRILRGTEQDLRRAMYK